MLHLLVSKESGRCNRFIEFIPSSLFPPFKLVAMTIAIIDLNPFTHKIPFYWFYCSSGVKTSRKPWTFWVIPSHTESYQGHPNGPNLCMLQQWNSCIESTLGQCPQQHSELLRRFAKWHCYQSATPLRCKSWSFNQSSCRLCIAFYLSHHGVIHGLIVY